MKHALDVIGNLFSSIRLRVLLITLLPLLLAASALTVVTIYLRQQDSELNLQQFAETTIDNLASSAEFGLYSGNIDMLRRFTNIPLKNPYVAGIMFYNTNGQLLLSDGKAPIPPDLLKQSAAVSEFNDLRYYLKPIVVFEDDLMDQDNSEIKSRQIGWVALAITRKPLAEQHNQILLTSLLAFGLIFSLSLLLANRIGRSISRPIYQIADSVSRMESGNLKQRAPVIGTSETQLLASTLNRLAESVESTNLDLQERIAQATAKLQDALKDLELRNSDLEDIRIDLEAALSAKDAFLARMSHELRTPLTSVIGFNRLLDNSQLSSQQRQYSRNIEQASSLLLSTIEDILDFSKLESGAMTLETIDFNLLQCVEDLIALQACNVYDKDLELVLLFERDVPTQIQGDPVRLKQILNNLLSNAIKFTEYGEVILRISLVYLDNQEVTLQFMTKDSGIGIARENLRNLFQPFHQADNTISRRFGGTGLGLTICQQLIEHMGGDINIESTPGVGTEVSFNLQFPHSSPLKQTDEILDTVVNFPTLIIDSMPWSRRALRNNLSPWINDIYSIASHIQAITLLQQKSQHFNVVILSLPNSQLNEASTSKLLFELRTAYDGPILLLAGRVDFEGNEFQAIQHQFAPLYLLTKPARRLQLAQALYSIHQLAEPAFITQPVLAASEKYLLNNTAILIVEDNPFNRQLLHSIISLHGGRALMAHNGDEALHIFSQEPVDAILIDMHMPVLNGIETTKIIRQSHSKNVVIIGLTADLNSRNIELLRTAGADAVLSKPINEELLLATLGEKLGRGINIDTIRQAGLFSANTGETKIALLHELQRLIQELKKRFGENDINGCREVAHQLSGLAGLFGMDDSLKLIQKITLQLNASPPDALQDIVLATIQELTAHIEQETTAGSQLIHPA